MRTAIVVFISLVLTLPCAFAANAFIASTLGSHMVLQRGVSSSIYGWSSVSSSTITVAIDHSTYSTTSSSAPSAAGGFFWQVALPAVAESLLGIDIHINSTAGEAATLSDVLFGDVFFCSGQSNMQFAMPGVLDAEQQITRADNYSAIRIFDVGQDTNQPQSGQPLDDLFSLRRGWTVCLLLPICCTQSLPLASLTLLQVGSAAAVNSGDWTSYYSAVCWLTATEIFDTQLQRSVPIGLVSSNWVFHVTAFDAARFIYPYRS
jgi:hypothetical protein